MARRSLLTRGLLLAALVLAAHVAGMDWVARRLEASSSKLQTMAPVLFTRAIAPNATAVPPPSVVVAPPPRPRTKAPQLAAAQPASAAAPEERVEVVEAPPAEPARDPVVVAQAAQPPASAASAPVAAAGIPAQPVDAAAAAIDTWPADTKLSYRLGGRFRSGELFGDARVQWQRDGDHYQVRVDIDITLWATLVMTSQGNVTPTGLVPRVYEETRPGRKRVARIGEAVIALDNGNTVARPPGVQDTASQFVELSHRFSSGQELLEVGRSITFWMARPGGLDEWTYDVVEREVLMTPKLGPVEAFRLKPRPVPNARGNITAEMWFAPSLQYLPVRIKVFMGDQAYVDLLVDRVEQR